jgi:hypothetical protein
MFRLYEIKSRGDNRICHIRDFHAVRDALGQMYGTNGLSVRLLYKLEDGSFTAAVGSRMADYDTIEDARTLIESTDTIQRAVEAHRNASA